MTEISPEPDQEHGESASPATVPMTPSARSEATTAAGTQGLFLLVVSLTLLSLHVQGPLEFQATAQVGVAPWNLAIMLIVLLTLLRLGSRGIRTLISDTALTPLVFFFLMSSWMLLSVAWAGRPVLSSATAIAQVGNLLLLAILSSVAIQDSTLDRLNMIVFWGGVVVAVLSIALFLPALLRFPRVDKQGLGWVFDRGLALRARGLTNGPNVYSLYLSISLFTGLDRPVGRRRFLGLVAIGSALLLAMSRSLVVAIAGILLVSPLILSLRGRKYRGTYTRRLAPFFATILVLGTTGVVLVPTLRQFVVARVDSVHKESRLPKWSEAAHLINHPVRGNGLRSADEALGHFSHNTYLDTFVELGVVGTLIWLGFILSVVAIGVLRCTEPRSFPWLQGWLTVVLGSSTFSLLYNPFFSVVAGVLLAAAKLREARRP